jgi:hypothetical protein
MSPQNGMFSYLLVPNLQHAQGTKKHTKCLVEKHQRNIFKNQEKRLLFNPKRTWQKNEKRDHN